MSARFAALTLFLLLLLSPAMAQETVIVSDHLPINVRGGPGSPHPVIAEVRSGDALLVLERQPGYLKIRSPNGKEGWVLSRFVQDQPVAQQRLEALQASLQAAPADDAEREQLRGDLAAARAALARSQQRQDELVQALQQARAEAAAVPALAKENQRLRQVEPPVPPAVKPVLTPWLEITALPLLALVSLLLAALTALRWRRFRGEDSRRRAAAGQTQLEFAAAAEQAVDDLRQSIGGLANLVQGAQRRLADLERQSQQLEGGSDLTATQARVPEAIALAREGISALDIMRRCGLSVAEARLLAEIHAGGVVSRA